MFWCYGDYKTPAFPRPGECPFCECIPTLCGSSNGQYKKKENRAIERWNALNSTLIYLALRILGFDLFFYYPVPDPVTFMDFCSFPLDTDVRFNQSLHSSLTSVELDSLHWLSFIVSFLAFNCTGLFSHLIVCSRSGNRCTGISRAV